MISTDRATALIMRAAEARRSAEIAEDDTCRQTLLSLADTYDRIAARRQRVNKHAAMIDAQHPSASLR